MESRQKIPVEEEKTKTEEDKQMVKDMISENVEKKKENDLPSDNIQANLLFVDAHYDSILSSDFNQQKSPQNVTG